ncbi:uncharacterized protein LOC131015707 [Salvia miltiorrhiza]|uniref:uncharacterized protein LOC131015707 n=1 Tax=Salvia miltiorrhiza TaxID=226208 RepID=UPI0025AC35B5|nr:uncharacterized protein LOC131012897 isoform X2 [Salvia miltiorrhiza]XP_057800113.1 uncharacterized protein LOC131015707 [Salvia miltiorrhiza]
MLDDVDTPENFDDAHLDMPLSDEFVERATDCKLVEDSHMESCLPLAAKKAKKMKSNILKDKIQSISDSSHQLSEVVIEHNKGKRVPQTPTLKSRSGRTIKRRILD